MPKAKQPKTEPVRFVKVESSNLRSVGYDGTTSTLYVKFNTGVTYAYFDVDERRALKLMQAESHGEYFHAHIRDEYAYAKVEGKPVKGQPPKRPRKR